MKRDLQTICKWVVCWMVVFIVQKLYFILCTAIGGAVTLPEGEGWGDVVLNTIWHGMTLDIAAMGYIMALPVIVYLLVPSCKYRGRAMQVYYIIAAIIASAIIVVDAALYPFWHFKLDTTIFLYIDKPGDALASVSVWFVIWHVIQFLIWVLAIWKIADVMGIFKEKKSFKFQVPRWKTVFTRFCTFLIAAFIVVIAIRGGLGQGTNNVSAAYYSNNQYQNHCTVNPVFNMIFSIGDEEDFSSSYQYYSEKERSEYMKGIYHTDSKDTESLLKTKRPDILLIVWEGCCEYMFSQPCVTPYLNKTAAGGIDFTNCIANSFRTDRGLVSIMSGFPGLIMQSLMKLPEKSDFMPAFPQKLKAAGYETTFWYGGDITFTNMSGYMYQAGFEHHVCDEDFSKQERSSNWGVPDGILFKKLFNAMTSNKDGKSQLNAVMTLSSHEPWDVPTSRMKKAEENAFNYTDECIGRLLSQLRKTPLWNNLLVIITADHGLTGEPVAGHDRLISHIPMIWTGGAIKGAKQITTLMNQSDLAATLLGQLGISHKEFQFSRDVLSSSYVYPTATYCNKEGVMFVDSTGATMYSIDSESTIMNPDKTRERKAKATLQTVYKAVGNLGIKK